MTQAEHNARHPGMVCKTCPTTLAWQAQISSYASRAHLPWWKRWFR